MRFNLRSWMIPAMMFAGAATSYAATVWDGVYTDAQAARGKATYSGRCGGCHGEDFVAVARAPLAGNDFMDRWREGTIDGFFDFVKANMPRNAAGTVPEKDKVDVVAYILQANGFPAGSSELTTASIPTVLLIGKDGPKPLPDESTAITIGCFTGNGDSWTLTRAVAPGRASDTESTTPEELKKSDARALGDLTIKLSNVEDFKPGFKPEPLKGHKVQAKGLLHIEKAGQRLTVNSLESLSNACGA
jgi:mono/diheme cytochrome c family protein